MKHHLLKSLLPLSLCFLIYWDGLSTAAHAQAQSLPARIDIVVVEGEGVTTGARQRLTHDPVVRIEDDDHRPVAGAAVVFALPVSGTTGEFSNGSKTLTVITDKDGLASAHGLKTNDVPGKLQIYVTASIHGLRAKGLINQFVEAAAGAKPQTSELPAAKGSHKWKWALLGIAAAGGAGIYFGRHTSSPSPISVSTGVVVFGSPH